MRITLLLLSFLATPALSQPPDVLIEACNAMANAKKRLECLRAAMAASPAPPSQTAGKSTQQAASSKAFRRGVPESSEDPKPPSARELFARAFELRDRDPKAAAELFKQGLLLNPQDLDALRYLRSIQLKSGDEEGAQQSAQAINAIAAAKGTLPAFPRLPHDIAVPMQVLRELENPRNQIPAVAERAATNKTYTGKFLVTRHSGGTEVFAIGGLVEVLSHREQATKILTRFQLEGELLGGKESQFRLTTAHAEISKAGNLTSPDRVLTCKQSGAAPDLQAFGTTHPGVLYVCSTDNVNDSLHRYAYFADSATFSRITIDDWNAAVARIGK